MRLYTPVVRAKNNDLKAIELLGDCAKSSIRPLIEAPLSLPDGQLRTNVMEAAELLGKRLEGVPYYFDPLGIESFERHVIAFNALAHVGSDFTPTIGLGRGPIDYASLRHLVGSHSLDLAVRVDKFDLEDASEETWAKLIAMSAAVGIQPSKVSLLIDFGQLGNNQLEQMIDSVVDFLAVQPQQFRDSPIVVLGSSALSSVSPVPLDGSLDIRRRELDLWANLRFELDEVHHIGFGDYGIIDPSFIFPSGPAPNSNAKIRYTRGLITTYFRGHCLYNPNRFVQYHDLARRVFESDRYLGAGFSYGDKIIADCAMGRCGPGNLGTWVMADTNHHIEFTAEQVSRVADRVGIIHVRTEVESALVDE